MISRDVTSIDIYTNKEHSSTVVFEKPTIVLVLELECDWQDVFNLDLTDQIEDLVNKATKTRTIDVNPVPQKRLKRKN